MKTLKLKSLYRILLLIPMVWGMVNCDTEWLEPKPLSIFTPENAFVDARGMYGALTACEKNILPEWYGNQTRFIAELIFSEVCVDGGTDTPNYCHNFNIQITPSSSGSGAGYINSYWIEAYKNIKYANLVIARIDNATYKDEAERNAVLGSAYFHRAYQYYRLTQQFGDVPFIGREIKEPKLDLYSSKREVILEKIKKDMEFAAIWCLDNVDRGRVTKGACAHLLTKINLALGKFDDAIASASAVIDGGVYSLMTAPFGDIPKEDGDYLRKIGVVRDDVIARLHWCTNKSIAANKEVLFVMISREDLIDSRINLQITRTAGPRLKDNTNSKIYTPDGRIGFSDQPGQEFQLLETFQRGIGRARNTWYHTHTIWDDPNDLRHKKWNWVDVEDLVYNNPDAKKGSYYGKPFQFKDATGKVLTSDTVCNWYGWPHYKIYNPDPRTIQPIGGAWDYYLFRLAETYLLRAEAYWWKGQTFLAMADVNKVRNRAGCSSYTDEAKFDIGTILDERARELYYEEPRKTELTRIAFIFAQTGKPYKGKTYSSNDFGTSNFFYDRIMSITDWYNKGVIPPNGVPYTMSSYHVLWPIPQSSIGSNTKGVINQNFGYNGYENNVPPLTVIPPEDDN